MSTKRFIPADHQVPLPIEKLILNEQKELNQSGVKVLDFTNLYKEQAETIYRDRCCHVNRRGNDLLEDALVPEIIKALQILSKP